MKICSKEQEPGSWRKRETNANSEQPASVIPVSCNRSALAQPRRCRLDPDVESREIPAYAVNVCLAENDNLSCKCDLFSYFVRPKFLFK